MSDEPILEAEEIAALMKAVVPEEKAVALFAALPPVEQPKKIDSFEFNGNADVGPESFPMFSNMHERVAEMVTERWTHTLHRDIPVFFKDLLKRSYLDILDTDTPRVYFTVDSPGLDSMLIVLDMPLVIAYIDAVLGGDGIPDSERITLTAVETRLAGRIVDMFELILSRLWQPVRSLKLQLRRIDIDPMSLALTAEDTTCFSVTHIIVLDEEVRGEFSLHYPLPFLEPMLEMMRMHDRVKTQTVDQEWEMALQASIDDVPLTLRLELERCRMQVGDFLRLQPGDFLPLKIPEGEPLTLWAASLPMFLAQPGQHQGMLAAEIIGSINGGAS
jgi:flagellar motor switch protein FliM